MLISQQNVNGLEMVLYTYAPLCMRGVRVCVCVFMTGWGV